MSEYDLEIYFSPPHERCREGDCEKCRRRDAWIKRRDTLAALRSNFPANRGSVKAIPAHLLEAFK